MTLANYLYALVYSEVYNASLWQSWAVKLLENAEYNDDTEWLYDIVFLNNKDELFNAIYERMLFENYQDYLLTEIIQGYYYYQYQEKTISLYELLEKSGNVADAREDSLGCEFFYELENKIDTNCDILNSSEFNTVITNYFSPLCTAALKQKDKLENASLNDLKLN